ncbi:MAG: CxxC-x17-CxxC domain-containing protein [archaeon]
MRGSNRDRKSDHGNNSFGGFKSNFSSFSGPREMHPAKCSECGADCEVPFKPTEGKPVFCRDCYRKKKSY